MRKTILNYLQGQHVSIHASCQGQQKCGQCKVKVLNRTLSLNEKEKQLLNEKEVNEGTFLACFHEYQDQDEIVICQSDIEILDEFDIENMEIKKSEGIGLIIDIGTTTIVMKWIDRTKGLCLETVSFINPQVSFGGDVISRIQYQNEHNNTLLHDILVDSIEKQMIEKAYEINQIIMSGNTAMIHFLLGEDVKPLGEYPFIVPQKQMQMISSQHVFQHYPYDCTLVTFPHISAYVGGDIVAGIYATQLDQANENILFIDLGTNGEMVFGNKDSLIASSTAAGPAFEGVGISCGGGSVPGAISEIRLNPSVMKIIGDQSPTCLCGSGLISFMSEIVRYQMIDSIGKIKNQTEIKVVNQLSIHQKDIQNFQFAKAAIQSGISLLSEENIIDTIYISGGFGSHLKCDDLKMIGMIPHHIQQLKSFGNTSLKGCYQLLMTQDFERVKTIAETVKSINLAEHPDFEDTFLESLYFYDEDNSV